MLTEPDQRGIIFFDGVCGLCNGVVDQLVRDDKKGETFLFAPLQGATAKKTLSREDTEGLGSIVFMHRDQLYRKSTAALQILRLTHHPLRYLAPLGLLLPVFIRDHIYDWIARNRYAWFGEKSSCRLPTLSERSRFLD
jgi:predicted DCC family thiol-disulfide oxidoreductase YuxK